MLDQADYIEQYDRSGLLNTIFGQPDQLQHEFTVKLPKKSYRNIVVAGMGGSALAGEFAAAWLADKLPVPLEVVRGYDLPAYVGPDTLLVVSSYSGNTEETVAAYEQGYKRQATVVVMAAGGKIEHHAEQDKLPAEVLPTGLQPRFAVFYGTKALAVALEAAGLASGLQKALEELSGKLSKAAGGWAADVPTADNRAKQIAEAVFGNPMVIYGGPTLAMPAHKWKIDFNENAKNLAFWNQLPEFNHNEFIGWKFPQQKKIKVIELQSKFDNDRINRRFEISNKLLAGQMPAPIIVQAEGETKLEQMLWTMLLGDFTAAYVALLNQTDPTPVELIERLKKELG